MNGDPQLQAQHGARRERGRLLSLAPVASTILLLTASACQDTQAINGARARLDLARQRTDLGEMFLALRDLQSLGVRDPTVATELDRVDSGLKLEQQMKGDRADHSHEAAVKSAAAILEVFPDHIAARQTVKESGLIYRSLQTALTAIRDCFDWHTADGQPAPITVTTQVAVRKGAFTRHPPRGAASSPLLDRQLIGAFARHPPKDDLASASSSSTGDSWEASAPAAARSTG